MSDGENYLLPGFTEYDRPCGCSCHKDDYAWTVTYCSEEHFQESRYSRPCGCSRRKVGTGKWAEHICPEHAKNSTPRQEVER